MHYVWKHDLAGFFFNHTGHIAWIIYFNHEKAKERKFNMCIIYRQVAWRVWDFSMQILNRVPGEISLYRKWFTYELAKLQTINQISGTLIEF